MHIDCIAASNTSKTIQHGQPTPALPFRAEQVFAFVVRHYPGLQNEVKTLKGEIYDLRAKLKNIGKSQEIIENACQEIYTSVHEDEEGFI